MTSSLKTFYDNVPEREAVKEFMVEQLKAMAVSKTFEGEDVTGLKEARDLVERVFDELDALYGRPEPIKEQNSR